MNKATGKFQVKATPIEVDEASKRVGAMRMMFEKSFESALSAHGTVSMTGLLNQELGSGVYVAIEKIEGTLDGRKGTFHLAHASFMARGQQEQSVRVVPDSGTGDLVGLTGQMTIEIKEGQHLYTFEYTLA